MTHLFTELDDRTTAKFLNDPRHRCVEANPILGERPTQRNTALLEHGIAFGVDIFGYIVKRGTRNVTSRVERNAWMVPAIILSFGHGFMTQDNTNCW